MPFASFCLHTTPPKTTRIFCNPTMATTSVGSCTKRSASGTAEAPGGPYLERWWQSTKLVLTLPPAHVQNLSQLYSLCLFKFIFFCSVGPTQDHMLVVHHTMCVTHGCFDAPTPSFCIGTWPLSCAIFTILLMCELQLQENHLPHPARDRVTG